MKKNTKLKKIRLSVWLFLSLVILGSIVLFMFDFSLRMDWQIKQIVSDHLRDITMQSANSMEEEIDRFQKEIVFTADYLAVAGDLSEKQIHLVLDHMKEKCGFTDVRLVSPDGRLFSLEHNQLPASAGNYMSNLLAGNSGVTDIFRSNISGKDVFVVYAPVIQEGKVVGGIVGTTAIDQMIDLIESTGFDSHSYSYVIKPDGAVIVQTSHPESTYRGRAYFYFLDEMVDKASITPAELQAKMEQRERGMFTYSVNGEGRLAYYAPVNVNNWYVVTAVHYEVAGQYIHKINLNAFQLTLKVAAVFLLLAVVILFWSRKTTGMILNSKEELELGNQKLKLALAHSSNTIFEYLVKEDKIIFLSFTDDRWKTGGEAIEHVSGQREPRNFVDPEYFPQVLAAIKEASLGNDTEEVEFLAGSVFGDDVWFKMTLASVRNAEGIPVEVIGTVEDITKEVRIRRRYSQEEQYRTALLSEAVVLWSVDLNREILMTGSAFGKDQMEGKISIPYDENLIRRFCRNIAQEEREEVWKFLQTASLLAAYYTGQRELKKLFRFYFPDQKEPRWVSCSISLLNEPSTENVIAFAYLKDVDEETRLAYTSERDPLTGLFNRRNIDKKVDAALAEKVGMSCLMMMDLDGFKEINDRFGHQKGDLVLEDIGRILVDAFRSDDLVARLGGDEFLVFLSGLPDKELALKRSEAVRQAVYDMGIQEENYDISISIGIAFAPDQGTDFKTLYKEADEALYLAKRSGKNQIRVCGEES